MRNGDFVQKTRGALDHEEEQWKDQKNQRHGQRRAAVATVAIFTILKNNAVHSFGRSTDRRDLRKRRLRDPLRRRSIDNLEQRPTSSVTHTNVSQFEIPSLKIQTKIRSEEKTFVEVLP